MTNLTSLIDGFQKRDAGTLTRSENQGREITAIGVPYGVEIDLGEGYRETFAPGSVLDDDAILRYGHREPLGKITAATDVEKGRKVTGVVSSTIRGDEILTLVADGVLTKMSIGFDPISHEVTERADGTTLITWTQVRAREYSIVEFPAYSDAEILNLRHKDNNRKDTPVTDPAPEFATLDDLTAVRSSIDDLTQAMSLLRAEGLGPKAAPADTRSVGQVLKDLVSGDDQTLRQVNALAARSWDGSTTAADATMDTPAWIGDLTRLYNAPDPLKGCFASGPLPAEGMSLEYAELDANTITVEEQKNQGDDLTLGKITTKDASAPIKTFGGYTSLSRQAIERSRINLLNHHMTGMTLAAAKADAGYFAAQFAAAVSSQAAQAISVNKAASALTWADLSAMVIDAAAAYSDQALSLDGLIVDKATFKALAALTGSDDRPLMSVSGTPTNTVGTLNLTGLSGSLVGVQVIPNLRQKADELGQGVVGAFFNSKAIRYYSTSLVQLQDENIINLTRAFSVYRYAAAVAEIPSALVPLKIGAGA